MDNRCICPLCSEDAEAGDMKYTAGKICIYAFVCPTCYDGLEFSSITDDELPF